MRNLSRCVLAVLMAAPAAYAQPADPTDITLVPRAISLEVDDPDVHIKKAANDIVNEEILSEDKFNELLALSFAQLSEAIARFNTTNYGRAVLFLKGGNALRHYYNTQVAGFYREVDQVRDMEPTCSKFFQQSDIDYAVNTQWNSNVPATARDFWLRDPTSNNEYGYQILNTLIIEGMDKLRTKLLEDKIHIAFAMDRGFADQRFMNELNTSFHGETSSTFMQKWADHRAAQMIWRDVILPSEPIRLSHQLQEFDGRRAMSQSFSSDELMGFSDEEESKKYNDIRNMALPDKVILEGPTPQLLYAYQRNHHVSSIYLTSNYAETWPSDPTIDATHYTKFALHRLKLSLPFRVVMKKTDNASKPFKKLIAKSFDLGSGNLGNVLVVGGELVDVGVDHPSATQLGHPTIKGEELVDMPVPLRMGGPAVVRAAGGAWLLRDLKDVVFDIAGMPWKKKKPEKRAGRFMCLIRPTLVRTNTLAGVRGYLDCLENPNGRSWQQCVTLFPLNALSGAPDAAVIADFFIGFDAGKGTVDESRHSIRRVMVNLPGEERQKAVEYLNLLRAFLR